MAKEIMVRHACDNEYLHKDFHGALSVSLDYLLEKYGDESVREYLSQFAASYYAPLIKNLKSIGLIALKEHFEKLYAVECGQVSIDYSDDELILNIEACPAVTHMRQHGYSVSKLFSETSNTVNRTICEETPFEFEMLEYDEEIGKSVQRFYRRVK